ncbi:uncharacterized protein LOC141633741 [Silene latifolia]|uniref:uncharacterized protein LOC141633741 n=1 Tax=Silene latifolia TaxID=37657 RepID=UPI003D77E639
MDDEVFTMDDSNLSSAIENGVSKEFGMSMEIAAFNQVSMNLERQLDEKSPCQESVVDEGILVDETIDLSSPMASETSKEIDTSMEIVLLKSISMDLEKQYEAISPRKGGNNSFSCVEAEQSELIGRIFDSDVDAYEVYSKPLRLVQRKEEIELELCLLLIIMVIATSIFTIF